MSDRKWLKDINYNILPDGRHWTESFLYDPGAPDPVNDVHVQWRRNLSNNTLMNLFGPDIESSGDARSTHFEAYYESPIHEVLYKFAHRLDTLPWDEFDRNPKQHSKFMRSTIVQAQGDLRAAADYARANVRSVQMKHLYLRGFYNHSDKANLLELLELVRVFKRRLEWICIPFLNYPTDRDVPGSNVRPDDEAYRMHLYGEYSDNTSVARLPWAIPKTSNPCDRNPTGGTITDIGTVIPLADLDFHSFLFFKPTSQTQADEHCRARVFASYWGFFDLYDITDRRLMDLGTKKLSDLTPLSSGNGYRCQINATNGARECVPSNPSAFCVANGTNVCP